MPYPFSDTDPLTPLEDLLNDVVEAAQATTQRGAGTLATSGSGTPGAPAVNSAPVVFPTAFPAGSTVIVVASAVTNLPGNRFASAISADENGFTVNVGATSGTDQVVSYRWSAGIAS